VKVVNISPPILTRVPPQFVLKRSKLFEQLVNIWDMMQLRRDMLVADNALPVNYIQRPLGETIPVAVHIVKTRYVSFWMEVGQQWKCDAAHRSPGAMAIQAVHRHANNLGVELFEFAQLALIQAELVAASRTPVQRIKDQNDVLTAEIGKSH
jgi:hypothetical protein